MRPPPIPSSRPPTICSVAWTADGGTPRASLAPPPPRPRCRRSTGYAEPLRRSGFHPLDVAWHLQEDRWPEPFAGLVAHHSAAGLVAAVRGLADPMDCFASTRYAWGPLADALTFADRTTGPDGDVMDVEDRLADMLRRHGPDSPNARAHAQRVRPSAPRSAAPCSAFRAAT